MENFKKELQQRLILASIYCTLVAVVLVGGIVYTPAVGSEDVNDFISGFDLGFCIGIEIFALISIGRYVAALRNGETLRRLYITETDERNQLIKAKTGGTGINVIILGLIVGALVAGYFNGTAFFALFGAAFFAGLVKAACKLYYSKRY